MLPDREKLAAALRGIVANSKDRIASLQEVANLLQSAGGYRWVGIYEVDHDAGLVKNIVWSGPGAPEYPVFSVTKGLTSAAISGHKSINIGDVTADPRYLTAFGSTRSEIIVPIFDSSGQKVVGTLDVESEYPNAFDPATQFFLEACSAILQPLWHR
jgi:putative methionine-R-sulfoxide reductase with GAF domain